MTDHLENSKSINVQEGEKPLLLCTITSLLENGEIESNRSANFSRNLVYHQISPDSMFYKFVKQESLEEISTFKNTKKRFHEVPPVFFRAGS